MLDSLFSDWITIGEHKLELFKLCDFDDSDYQRSNKHFYSYCGGPIINFSSHDSRFLNLLSNSGKAISHPIQFRKAEFATTVFGFPNGHLCFLSYDGIMTVTDTQGNLISEVQSIDSKAILCTHVTSRGYVYIKENHILYFENTTNSATHFSYQLSVDSDPCFVRILDDDPFIFIVVTTSNSVYSSMIQGTVLLKHFSDKITSVSAPFKGSTISVVCGGSVHFVSLDPTQPADLSKLRGVSAPFGWIARDVFMYTSDSSLHLMSPKASGCVTLNVFQVLDIFEDVGYARVYARSGCYILRSAPASASALFTDRLAPSVRKLSESYDLYLKRSIDSYNVLQVLKGNVENVVSLLLSAARDSLDVTRQRYLLSLACYGRYSYGSKNASEYTDVLRRLRLLNTLNSTEYGLALTPEAMHAHTGDIFSAVMEMHYYQLAISMCDIFHFSVSTVVEHWSVSMLAKFGDSALSSVLARCSKYDAIDYRTLGDAAIRLSLSFRTVYTIAQRIPSPKERIQFIYPFDKDSALNIVLHSLDGDAVVTYMMLLDKSSRDAFVDEYPRFLDQFFSFMKYRLSDDLAQPRAGKAPGLAQRLGALRFPKALSSGAYGLLHGGDPQQLGKSPAVVEFSEGLFNKKSPFSGALSSQKKLLQLARKHKVNVDQFSRFTPREMLVHAIVSRDEKLEKEVAKVFGFSTKVVTYTKLDTFARNHMIQDLEDLGRIPNAEVGWDVFASVCLKYDEIEHAMRFIGLIKDKRLQMDVFVRHGLFSQASKIASELGLTDLAMEYRKRGREVTA